MAFATVEDLQARWRTLTDEEQERAGVLLEDAATMLSSLVHVCDEDEQQLNVLKIVSCNMVQRVMAVTEDIYGITTGSMQADIYSQSWTYANPSGNMYLTKAERDMLGLNSSYIHNIRPVVWGDHVVD